MAYKVGVRLVMNDIAGSVIAAVIGLLGLTAASLIHITVRLGRYLERAERQDAQISEHDGQLAVHEKRLDNHEFRLGTLERRA